jgi:hypothetical protein
MNKGEWSEIYVFFKLLADGKLYAADKNLMKQKLFYLILAILEDANKYEICDSDVKVSIGSLQPFFIDRKIFYSESKQLYRDITSSKTASGMQISQSVINLVSRVQKRKKSPSNQKKDITLVIHDPVTSLEPTVSFSIKSMLGNASTLLNASQGTIFEYDIKGISINGINAVVNTTMQKNKGIKSQISALVKSGATLEFRGIPNKTFERNLVLIDTKLPELLASMLVEFFSTKKSDIKSICNSIAKKDPMKFGVNSGKIYEHKIKNLLMDAALGMVPNTEWIGNYDANGGYIIVKEDGEILCYHVYNLNDFRDYLFENTKFDVPSFKRYKCGIFGNKLKLNFQIRFKK